MSRLRRHGYVILTGMRRGEALAEPWRRRWGRGQQPATAAAGAGGRAEAGFFLSSLAGSAAKAVCRGEVYESERGVPMWRCGYEFVEDKVREAFRVRRPGRSRPGRSRQPGRRSRRPGRSRPRYPSRLRPRRCRRPSAAVAVAAARAAWVRLVAFCRGGRSARGGLTDAATAVTAATDDATNATNATTATTAAAVAERGEGAPRFSVAYALHNPNEEGGAPTLPPSVTGGVTHINVKVSQLASQQVTQVTQSSSVRLSRQ